MKLFTKYSRINLVVTIAIFLIASTAFYLSLNYVLLNQIDHDLKIEEKEIETFVSEHGSLPEIITVRDQVITYTPINESYKDHYFTTIHFNDNKEKENEAFRQIVFGIEVNQHHYKVTVSKSLEETDALIHSILLISSITILLMLLAFIIINRVVLKRIWRPFYTTLEVVKNFKVGKIQKMQLEKANIEEFDFMNQILQRITQQAQVDYITLKTFSENAAHEMQTPLAVIRSKLDNLIQDEQLTEQQSKMLLSTFQSIQKLSKLNQSLLLLAKIENNQFEEHTVIHLKNEIEEKLSDFQELWLSQHITVSSTLQAATLQMNKELFETLLNNLLSNATRHNYSGGHIHIDLSAQRLEVRNSSHQPKLDHQKLFHRFYKPSENNEHNGLGLSIIKQICEVSSLAVTYQFHTGQHSFIIRW